MLARAGKFATNAVRTNVLCVESSNARYMVAICSQNQPGFNRASLAQELSTQCPSSAWNGRAQSSRSVDIRFLYEDPWGEVLNFSNGCQKFVNRLYVLEFSSQHPGRYRVIFFRS
jgi:hypothetical protein